MDTIAAISTPSGEGGIGIIRISGSKALKIADKIFKGKIKPGLAKTHTIHYGKIIDNTGKKIDECLLMIMLKPHTYTTEDTIEINIHSGIVPLRNILETVLKNGARLAEPGEFTRRAFMAGKIDLIQAEAVLDIIQAKSEKALTMAINQLEGKLSDHIKKLKNKLLKIITNLETDIEFSEEEIKIQNISPMLKEVQQSINKLLISSKQGKLLKEGVTFTLIGKTNVGKSSIFNSLLGKEQAIVTKYPGTTRDTIEAWVDIKGLPLKLIDTAGLMTTNNPMDMAGQQRTQKAIRESDGILFIFDATKAVTKGDIHLLTSIKDKKVICIFNKCDLPHQKIVIKNFNSPFLSVSALNGTNIDLILKSISKLVILDNIPPLVSKIRHIETLEKANLSIKKAISGMKNLTPECLAYEIKEASTCLSELTGEITNEIILNQIFSEFCIGK
ncbi:MAG: tRNA uridine-5-carboxymethylaminomethyl(34) synthesis GTPase MnmE [bacterium]|nr:tRNA uridine-5-carboxymethylaminomethyl(34) synthesis GTPase MnmE [bacterium]